MVRCVCRFVFLRVDERSSDSYMSHGDFFSFFFSFKICKNYFFFAVLTLFLFKVQFISCVKRKANFTIEQQKCKGHKKRD